jgi:hypothetical protein
VLVRDNGPARPAEVPKILERDEDERAAARVAAFADHRHAGCEVQRLGPVGDAVVRRADGIQTRNLVRAMPRVLDQTCLPQFETSLPAPQGRINIPVTLWEERAARNEALFRDVNEEIRDVDRRFGGAAASEFVCECANGACIERLPVPLDVYTAVRSEPTRFIVAPGHENSELEGVVERHDRFFVVEKFGTAGRIAERLDPGGD